MSGQDTVLARDRDDDDRLATARLQLRPAALCDAGAIALHANDRHIAEMTARIPHPYSLMDAERFLGSIGAERVFAVLLPDEDRLIGLVSLAPRAGNGRFELGYWLGRPFWGAGYATEAAQAMIDHAFRTLGAEIVEIRCRVVNGGSRRVIQKCGFQYAGTGMDVSLCAGRVASETYRMDRRCWQSLKAWGGR